jgi:hypothetical protein
MARRTKREIMAGVDCVKSRLIDHNTVEYERANGERVIRLHLTDIVTYRTDGTVVLNTGGWNTITTRDRINKQLEETCPGWRMWSEQNEPYLGKGWWHDENRKVYHFHDGIVISVRRVKCDGKIYDKEQVKKAKAWQRKCKQYAKTFTLKLSRGEINPPGPGDCWMCSMVSDKGVAWGESGHDDHVYGHVIEKYYVPSMVLRAIDQFGVSMCAKQCLAYVWNNPDKLDLPDFYAGIGWGQIQKAITKYVLRWAPYDEGVIARIEEEVAA